MLEEDRQREELGALIRQARTGRGLTVTGLGQLVYGNSGKSNVSRVERGELGVAPDTALRYLEHLGLKGMNRRRFLELTGLAALALALQREGVLPAAGNVVATGQDLLDRLTGAESDAGEFYIPAHELERPRLLWMAGWQLELEGQWEQAQSCYQELVELLPAGSEQARACIAYAHQFINLGDLSSAGRALGQIMTDYEGVADPLTLAWAQARLGRVHHLQGRYHQAEANFSSALQAAQQFSDRELETEMRHFLGRNLYEVARRLGNLELMEAALSHFDRATALSSHPGWQPFHLRGAAWALEELKRYPEMRACRAKALWWWKADQAPYRTAFIHVDNARTDLRAGRYQEAIDRLYESAGLFADAKCADSVAGCLVGLAEVYFEHRRLASVRHIVDLCISAVCLYPYPHNPAIERGLSILRTLSETDPDTVKKRLIRMEFEPVFSARTARELIPEPLERRADVQAGYRVITSALGGNTGPILRL